MREIRKIKRLSKAGKTGERRRSLAALFLTLGAATLPSWPGLASAQTSVERGSRAMEVVAKESASCFALLVGVDKYENITPLNYAGSDARAIRETLLKIGFKEENIWMFASDGSRYEQPTKANIERAFKEILAEAGPGATIFVALSGHGFETQDGEAAFCPKGVEVEIVDGAKVVTRETAIVVNDITAALRKDDAKFKLLIVDACRESATAKNAGGATGRPFENIDASGVAFLQSCQTRQFSYEDAEFDGGLFTHYFIEGLNGAADADGDGGVSFLDVCGYVSRKTQERALAVFKSKQTPRVLFDGSDFWLTEPTRTPGGGNATSATPATPLFTEAFQAFSAKDYATARNLLAMIEEAQKPRTGGTPETQPPTSSGDWFGPHAAGTAKSLTIQGLEYRFHYCPAGSFTMGSPTSENYRDDNETRRRVELTNGFWMLETEVTQAMWKSLMGSNPSYFSSSGGGSSKVSGMDTSNFPVENVSWTDCQDFIEKLNSGGYAPSGFQFRLPSEAQWEYACRAGTTTAYFWGSSLNGDKANCDGNYPYGTPTKGKYLARTTEVGSYYPNLWGLRDMHGNVWEWCEDKYAAYDNSNNARDPINVTKGSYRVLRGGSWNGHALTCRSPNRNCDDPTYRSYRYGFRLALVRSSSSSK